MAIGRLTAKGSISPDIVTYKLICSNSTTNHGVSDLKSRMRQYLIMIKAQGYDIKGEESDTSICKGLPLYYYSQTLGILFL